MSYDIYLEDPVTGKSAVVYGHYMTGGTYKADYHPETNTFTPALNTEAELNITYNYSTYYYEAHEDGIRCIYGKQGVDSIAILENMIKKLEEKYKADGEWITTKRVETVFLDADGNVVEDPSDLIFHNLPHTTMKKEVDRYEGPNDNYWRPTAANAIKPLYQLLALAKMRPDCIWDGD